MLLRHVDGGGGCHGDGGPMGRARRSDRQKQTDRHPTL